MNMTERALFYPLRYFSFGLSSCIHVLLLIFAFAGIYQHMSSDYAAPYGQSEEEYDDSVVVYDSSDDLTDPQSNEMSSDSSDEAASTVSETSLAPEADQPYEEAPTQSITPTRRKRSGISRWKKNTTQSITQSSSSSSERPLTKTQQAGKALQDGFGSFVQQEQLAAADKMRAQGTSYDDIARERDDYHRRVLDAIKATTKYFVQHYYAQEPFFTKRVHVQFSLNENGSITAMSIEPSTGNKDLDEAIRKFVMSAKFSKKPTKLTVLRDDPYDFYILPLAIEKGENILRLVACF